jgi:hypothetical protein
VQHIVAAAAAAAAQRQAEHDAKFASCNVCGEKVKVVDMDTHLLTHCAVSCVFFVIV